MVLDLSKTKLFQGVSQKEAESMLDCLQGEKKFYQKGEMILRMGDTVSSLGMVLSGSVMIESDDIWGNRKILLNTLDYLAEQLLTLQHNPSENSE